MGHFYIISDQYYPNTAATNHGLGFIKGFSEIGVKADWIFVLPSDNFDVVSDEYKGVRCRYLWNKKFSKNKILKHLFKWIPLFRFFLQLKSGDKILFLGGGEFLWLFLRKKGVKIYHERTEHPDVIKAGHFPWSNFYYKKIIKKVDGLFVISQKLRDYFVSIGCPDNKVHVINMIVDSNRFKFIEKQKKTENYIAYCGNASNSKDGVNNLIRAFKNVVAKFPLEKLYIIGQKPPEESDNTQLVESLGLRDNVVFTGLVVAEQIPQLLINADILALCRPSSLQNEMGFPTKLGEYLLTGNPVVVTKVGDIPRFLKDGESALMVETTDVQGFGEKMIWALSHKKEAEEIGLKGKRVAEDNFDYLKEANKLLNVIQNDEY